jgi:hypothetical protein
VTVPEFKPLRSFNVVSLREELRDPTQLTASIVSVGPYPQLFKFLMWVCERFDTVGDNFVTLQEAREYLKKTRGAGAECPCCGQYVKVYKRALTKEMAGCLVDLVLKYYNKRAWIPVRELETRGGDYAKLLWWNLIQFESPKSGSARAAGGMRPTPLGVKFALNRAKVASHVLLYNNKSLGFDGSEIGIEEVPNFNYSEIRAAVAKTEELLL